MYLVNTPISQVWLDVSLLLECNTNQPTGIPRTTINIFRHWWETGYTNLRLCRLDIKQGGYFPVDPQQVLQRFGSAPLVAEEAAGEAPEIAPPVPVHSLKSSIRSAGRALLRRLPSNMQEALRDAVRNFRKWKSAPPSVSSVLTPVPPLQLGPSDLVVTLGGGWTQPGSSNFLAQLHKRTGYRSVHVIYDMIPLKLPQFYPKGMYPNFFDWMSGTLHSLDLAISISEHTRVDLIEFCQQHGFPVPPVEVIRLGEGISPTPAPNYPPISDSFNPREPFVMTVGTLEIRKNHHLIYHVWRRLVDELGEAAPRLVVIGSPGWLAEEVLHLLRTDPLTRDRVTIIPTCDDAQLRWLYQHCLFTVYPSHYEGWGLPIAESLAFGKYCICSNTSSMPEIARDLVSLQDPGDVPGWLTAIKQTLEPGFLPAQEKRIRRDFRRTSWADTARQFAGILNNHFGSALQLPHRTTSRSA
ncbi:MAG: glycosyltransferase family 1 protein [Gemmataceae bacterium]